MPRNMTFSVSDTSSARLDMLMEKTGAANVGEIVQNALRLFENAVQLHSAGLRFQTVMPDGAVQPWDVFGE